MFSQQFVFWGHDILHACGVSKLQTRDEKMKKSTASRKVCMTTDTKESIQRDTATLTTVMDTELEVH